MTIIRKNYGGGLPVFDEKTALMYSGDDADLMMDFIKDFLNHKPETVKNLNTTLAEKNWADYTTFAHALKSTSLSMGGKKLSETAKAVEQAGKDYAKAETDDEKKSALDFIAEHHGEMMNYFDELAAALEERLLAK